MRRSVPIWVSGILVAAACGAGDQTTAPGGTVVIDDSVSGSGSTVPESNPPATEPVTDDAPAPAPAPGPTSSTATTTTTARSLEPSATPPTPADPDGAGTVDPALASFVNTARADLAGRLGVDPDVIEVVLAELVVWPDSSRGCPRPGMEYLQVLTDGYRIVLRTDSAQYSYHGGGASSDPFLCERPAKPVPDAMRGNAGGT